MANGEILGITLLMEDVLSLNPEKSAATNVDEERPNTPAKVHTKQHQRKQTKASIVPLDVESRSSHDGEDGSGSTSKSDKTKANCLTIENYRKWHHFLMTWKRCELLKLDWGRRKLGVENINTPNLYAKYW